LERDRFEALHDDQDAKPLPNQFEGKGSHASTKEANNRYRLIAMMLELLSDKEKRRLFSSQEELKDYLTDEVRKTSGLSKRNLEIIFAEANSTATAVI
jgi:hypothetical protein